MSAENAEKQLTPRERFDAVFQLSAQIIGGEYSRFTHKVAINRLAYAIRELDLASTPGILEKYGGLVSLAMCRADEAGDTTTAQSFRKVAEYVAEKASHAKQRQRRQGPVAHGFSMN